jgi:hypothetical protein
MKRQILFILVALLFAGLACENGTPAPVEIDPIEVQPAERDGTIFDTEATAYGFFPSPPEASTESVLNHFEALGQHADFILFQSNIPWEDFLDGVEGKSQAREDLRNQTILAQRSTPR